MSILAPEAETEVGLPLLDAAEPIGAPFINLLPPEIVERRALRKLGGLLAAGLLLVVALTGGLVYMAGSGKADAQADLTSVQTQGTRLQAQITSLDGARKAQEALQAAQTALQTAMSNEVLWSRYLDDLRGKLPPGVRLSNVGIAPAGGTASTGTTATAAAPTPAAGSTTGAATGTGITPGAVATITLTGKAVSQDAVASWLEALDTVKGFTNTYLTSTTGDPKSGLVSFIVTVDVTSDALSHRFDTPAGS